MTDHERAQANLAISHEIIKIFMRENLSPNDGVDTLACAVAQTYIARYSTTCSFKHFITQFAGHCTEVFEEMEQAAANGTLHAVMEHEGRLN